MTFSELFRETRCALESAQISSPDLEARLIVQSASGKTCEEYIRDNPVSAHEDIISAAREMTRRRLGGEPVAYITGEWEFFSLPIYVDRSTLIPRADTEVLAERAISLLAQFRTGGTNPVADAYARTFDAPRVLDLCAGTGCIGLAIAANTAAHVTLADISENAVSLCRKNALRNSLSARTDTVRADALAPPAAGLSGFDMLVCNPPYIPSGDIAALDRSVREFEPVSALDGGGDGLLFYRAVAEKWIPCVKPGGYILLECGIGQAQDVCAMFAGAETEIIADTAGIDRVVQVRKPV